MSIWILELRAGSKRQGPIDVNAKYGQVVDTENGLVVGFCDELPNGAYTMSAKGVIVVRRPTPNSSPPSRPRALQSRSAGELESNLLRHITSVRNLGGCRPPWGKRPS